MSVFVAEEEKLKGEQNVKKYQMVELL